MIDDRDADAADPSPGTSENDDLQTGNGKDSATNTAAVRAVQQPTPSSSGYTYLPPLKRSSKPNIRVRSYEYWNGPLPHPDILIRYNDAAPNGADRILKMAERQEEHRIRQEELQEEHERQMERDSLDLTREQMRSDVAITTRSRHYGLIILLTVIIAGVIIAVLSALTHTDLGVLFGSLVAGGGLVGLAAVFFRQSGQPQERRKNVTDVVTQDDESQTGENSDDK